MRVPLRGEALRSAKGELWIVLRCHLTRDDPQFFAIDLIRQHDLQQTSRAVNLTRAEFEDFCRKEGIAYPPPER
jgi:hypothetical protein